MWLHTDVNDSINAASANEIVNDESYVDINNYETIANVDSNSCERESRIDRFKRKMAKHKEIVSKNKSQCKDESAEENEREF